MKKKRTMAAGLAVIMALTAAGCHQTSKGDTSTDNSQRKARKRMQQQKKV